MQTNASKSIYWKVPLGVLFPAGALFYVLYGRFEGTLSQGIIGVWALVLFAFTIRYTKRVEGKSSLALIRFSFLMLAVAWTVEAVSQNTGILGSSYRYDLSHLASFGLAGVPVIVPVSWLLFSLLSGSIVRFLAGQSFLKSGRPRSRGGYFLFECVLSGWVFLAIDFAIEWHFSGIARFWVWQNESNSSVFGSIPAGNFILWFGLGLIVPIAERLTRARAGSGIRRSLALQALPAAGLGLLQLAGIFLNLAVSFLPGVLFCSLSFFILAGGLVSAFRPARRLQSPFRVSAAEPLRGDKPSKRYEYGWQEVIY